MGFLDKLKESVETAKKETKEYKEKLKNGGKSYGFGNVKYLGGYGNVAQNTEGRIIINKLGVFFENSILTQKFIIPIQSIVKAEFKTHEEISKDVTFTRLFVLGIFAFAFKKKKKEITNYLVITYQEAGIENTILFEAKKAGELAGVIIKAKKEYIKENLMEMVEQSQPNEINDNSTEDIPEQIRKLAELKEAGIITDEEFQEKKKILLEKIS